MGNGIKRHLTFANVASALALFVALATGGAYAANTVFSRDIVDGQVKSVDLADAAVTTQKLAGGAVTSDKVKDETLRGRDVLDNGLKGADIDESTLTNIGGGGPAGGDLTGKYPNPQIAPNAVTGAEVANESLTGADLNEALLGHVPVATLGGMARESHAGLCDPEGTAFFTCASVTLDLPGQSNVLLIASVKAQGGGTGQCQLVSNHELAMSGFEAGDGLFAKFVPLMALDFPGAGSHTFALNCNELQGEQVYYDARIAAVGLSTD
jgi:hypothetical protein